jgi:hypothetical protein
VFDEVEAKWVVPGSKEASRNLFGAGVRAYCWLADRSFGDLVGR